MSQMFDRQRTMQTDPGTEGQLGPPAPTDAPAPAQRPELPTEQPAAQPIEQQVEQLPVQADPQPGGQPNEQAAKQSSEQATEQPIEQTDAGDPAAAQPVTLQTSPDESTALEGDPDTPFWSLEDFGGSGGLPGLLMAAGAIIIVFILMGRLRRGHRASSPDPRSNKEQIAEIRARAGDRSRIEAFKVDAQDFTRQMAALLDTKAERLEALIADADDRLARLERAAGDHRNGAPSRPQARPQDRPGHADANGPASRTPNGSADDPLHEQIYRLSDDGLDPVQIAKQTGQPTGQIELILALRS